MAVAIRRKVAAIRRKVAAIRRKVAAIRRKVVAIRRKVAIHRKVAAIRRKAVSRFPWVTTLDLGPRTSASKCVLDETSHGRVVDPRPERL